MSWLRFHPFTRITIVVAIVLGAALFTGWERVGDALANISPAGTFEDRCEGLPRGGVQVSVQPWQVVENQTLPFAMLTRISEGPSQAHRTIGLTQANFGHRSSIEVKGLEDRVGYRACVRPRVNVELHVRQLTVYVAREYASDPCRARAIREHEQRHVDVYTGYARESAAALASQLSAIVGTKPLLASSVDEAQRRLDRRVQDTLDAFMRESERTLAIRQAHVDTPEEYARVGTACLASAQ
jgi:hypothetical protein